MIKVGVTRENVLSTYNEQVQKLYGAMTISTAAMSEQFHLELEGMFFAFALPSPVLLHSFLLSCWKTDLQSPSSTIQEGIWIST